MSNGGVNLRCGGFVASALIAGVAASALVAATSPAEAARRKKPSGYNPPFAALVVDVKTGRTLHAQNEDALRHPASVTKVMTLYLLFEQLERGKLNLDSPLRVSAHSASMAPSKLGLRPGSTIEVEDAIKALITKSANDVAATVAENIAGSEEDFAELMTRRARQLGMSRTVFRNASGLPNPAQVTTARDLAILARAIQDRFPRYYRYFQTRHFEFAGRGYRNHNKLLGRVEGVDGIKTGYVRASGFNLMTNAKTDDRHIVAIVLGGRSGASRDQIVANLVRQNLPRAYAGARMTPAMTAGVETAERARPAVAAAAVEAPRPAEAQRPRPEQVDVTATTTPARPRAPLDLNAMRPAVASAAGGSTTTPGSGPAMRWNQGPAPATALAYASAEPPTSFPTPAAQAARPAPAQPAAKPVEAARPPEAPKPPAAKADAPRPGSGWVIQLGAMDDEDKALSMLADAKSKSGRTLSQASGFTEKVTRDGTTLFRARFSGFDEADEAQEACKTLKRSGFACFATRI